MRWVCCRDSREFWFAGSDPETREGGKEERSWRRGKIRSTRPLWEKVVWYDFVKG